MTVEVVRLTAEREPAYAAFVAAHPAALISYTLAYRDMLAELLGCRPRYALALRDGVVAGVMPLMSADGARGTVLNSLPYFGSNGGPLAHDAGAAQALVDWYAGQARVEGVLAGTVVANPLGGGADAVELGGDLEDVRVGHVTPLGGDGAARERIAAAIDGSARRNVAKALRCGAVVTIDNEAFEPLEALHRRSMEAIGAQVKAPAFFAAVARHFRAGEDFAIYLAHIDGEAVAALLIFVLRRHRGLLRPGREPRPPRRAADGGDPPAGDERRGAAGHGALELGRQLAQPGEPAALQGQMGRRAPRVPLRDDAQRPRRAERAVGRTARRLPRVLRRAVLQPGGELMAVHVGVVSSSNGETFAQMCRGVEHLPVSFSVITDRPCGIEAVARERGIACRRLDGDRDTFSQAAADELRAGAADMVLLYFNRLVGPQLHAAFPTYNIHPSLLPAFPGFGALEGARERGVRYLGATLHLATEHADSGPIVAQVSAPIWPPCSPADLDELSFVQRVYLSLLCVELVLDDALEVDAAAGTARHVAPRPYTDRANPAIQDPGMLALVDELEAARSRKATG